MARSNTGQLPMQNALLDESHHISERVTRVETQITSLASSMATLAATANETASAVSEIRSMVGSVGKMDGKTILTVGGATLATMTMIAALFLGPLQRDMLYMNSRMDAFHAQMVRHEDKPFHDGAAAESARLDGELKMLDLRLRHLEGAH